MKFVLLQVGVVGVCLLTMLQAFANPTQKEETPLIARQLLFGNPEKTSPQISPDATQMAYIAPDENNTLNVWIRPLSSQSDNGKKDACVTSDRKRGIRSFLWQYDNRHILYIQDRDGDENWHLYQTDIYTKETRDLTPYEGCRVDITDYDYKFPQEILVQMNRRDPSLFDVYRINLQTGACQLDTENPDGVLHWVADHHLQVRACQSYTKDGSTLIRVRDTVNAPWRELLTIDPLEIGGVVVGFTADNQSIYLITGLDGNTARLLKVNTMDGKRESLVEDPNYDLSDIMLHPTTYALEAAALERDRFDWIVLDPKLTDDFEELRRLFGKGTFKITSRDLSNRLWVVASISDQRPTHFYLYNRNTKQPQFLFSTLAKLDQVALSPMAPITFSARDGMTIHGYLTLPVGKVPHQLPTVLIVHGGPQVRDTWGLNPAAQWLANRGYAVLQINYRGSTGYGKQYLNAGNREWAGKMHTDLLDGKQWMIQKGYTDPDKVAIYGGSYGGYATLVGLTFTPDEFCCGVDIVGPSNLITLLQSIPPYWAPFKAVEDLRIGSLDNPEFLKSRSPLFKVDQIKKPLLVGHGANDPRVKLAESDQIVKAMRDKNLPVEYLVFDDEGHGFARPENRIKFYAAAEHFLAEYLGGRCEAPSAEEDWKALKR